MKYLHNHNKSNNRENNEEEGSRERRTSERESLLRIRRIDPSLGLGWDCFMFMHISFGAESPGEGSAL